MLTKVPLVKTMVFPVYVWIWELDYKESWVSKNWCFWTVVSEKTLESPLDCQGDQTSQSWRKSILNIHWKGWCWSWNSNSLPNWCEELTHWKGLNAGKDWRWEGKGTTEDEMVGWHHWLNGHKFELTPGIGDGQGSLVCCSPWVRIVRDDCVSELNWTEFITFKPLNCV